MAPLEFLKTTLVNGTENSVYITFPPAPPLEIPSTKDLKNYSAKIDEIFIYDVDEEAEDCYTLKSELALGPGCLVTFVTGPNGTGLTLKYRLHGGETDEHAQMEKISGGHKLHREIKTFPLSANTALHHYCGIADEDAGDAETMLNVGDTSDITPAKDAFWEFMNAPTNVSPAPKSLGGPTTTSVGAPTTGTGSGPPPHSGGPTTTPAPIANVVIVSNQGLNNPALAPATIKGYKDMMSILSIFMLLASFAIEDKSRQLKRKISPIKDTALYMETIADAYLKAPFDRLLSGILIASSAGGATFNRTCLRRDVHATFLHEFAQDFKFDAESYKTLDKMLTEFSRSVMNGNLQGNQKVSFTLARPWIPVERIPGSSFSMVMPKLKIYFISAASQTFKEIVGRGKSQSTVEKVNLQFQYNAQMCDLNEDAWDGQKAKIDAGFKYMTGSNFAGVQNSVGQAVIVP